MAEEKTEETPVEAEEKAPDVKEEPKKVKEAPKEAPEEKAAEKPGAKETPKAEKPKAEGKPAEKSEKKANVEEKPKEVPKAKEEAAEERSKKTGRSTVNVSDATPGQVVKVFKKVGQYGECYQVLVRVLEGKDRGNLLRRNVRGPIKENDLLMLKETERDVRAV